MSKEEEISFEGLVTDILPNNMYRVKIDKNEHTILAYMSGKMRQNKIKVLLGDRVTVSVTPYDLTRGRLTYRYK